MGEAVNSEWRMNIAAFSVNKKQKTADRLSFLCKTYIFSILLCVFYSVVSLTVETLFGTLPKWLCWLMPIPLTTLWGAGDMVKHGFPLNVNALEAIIPSTFQTVIILGIMAVASISLIDFLYKKRGE